METIPSSGYFNILDCPRHGGIINFQTANASLRGTRRPSDSQGAPTIFYHYGAGFCVINNNIFKINISRG